MLKLEGRARAGDLLLWSERRVGDEGRKRVWVAGIYGLGVMEGHLWVFAVFVGFLF